MTSQTPVTLYRLLTSSIERLFTQLNAHAFFSTSLNQGDTIVFVFIHLTIPCLLSPLEKQYVDALFSTSSNQGYTIVFVLVRITILRRLIPSNSEKCQPLSLLHTSGKSIYGDCWINPP
ncbi:hypothetical protein Ddc_14884 [Ditylenchus destructor]|nr:hypothetical protein Ddc_14884 [Ditylenchus destructor]